MMIKKEFYDSATRYFSDTDKINIMWEEVEKNHNSSERHYHNLIHLDNLVIELYPYKEKFLNWDTVVFAVAYHDIVHNTLSNNEEKSAEVAVKRLSSIAFPANEILRCEQLILATKKHEVVDKETNLFTDADLSILGTDGDTYTTYTRQIRLEYDAYPDIIYRAGRKKVLMHFLDMDRIYKTDEFFIRYESSARENLKRELELLASA